MSRAWYKKLSDDKRLARVQDAELMGDRALRKLLKDVRPELKERAGTKACRTDRGHRKYPGWKSVRAEDWPAIAAASVRQRVKTRQAHGSSSETSSEYLDGAKARET